MNGGIKMLFDIADSRILYTNYGKIQLGKITKKFGSYGDDIHLKIQHGISMSYEVPKVMQKTGLFHESYLDSAAMDGLFHDIGRFQQYYLTGNLKDAELEELFQIKDHGRLGEILFQNPEFMKHFLKASEPYGEIIAPVIGNHTHIYQPQYRLNLSTLPSIFQEYSLEEILKMKKEEWKNWLIGAKIQFVQEADNFELIQNIVNHYWIPQIRTEPEHWVTKEAWNLFFHNQPIMISELKKKNSWTCNSGVILRYGLLPQKAQLRSTLEVLLEGKYLQKLYLSALENARNKDGDAEEIKDPLILDGYLYASLLTQNIVALSDTVITEKQRNAAVQLTKKMWKS